jgi:hypothetical protein
MRIFSDKIAEKKKSKHTFYIYIFFVAKIVPFLREYGETMYSWPGHG